MMEVTVGTQEYLTFRLGAEEYGIDILKVQEIRGYDTVTRIANAPAFIKGVINLRGVIVPIVDLRLKFNLGEAKYDTFTVVIILNVVNRVVGAVVGCAFGYAVVVVVVVVVIGGVVVVIGGGVRPIREAARPLGTGGRRSLAASAAGLACRHHLSTHGRSCRL
jgi:hypothetical protein